MDLQTLIKENRIYDQFFTDGKSGLTSTSANHLANLAKQEYVRTETELASVRFISKYIQVLNQPNAPLILLEEGINETDIQAIKEKLDKIAMFKGFIAWLREAINAKTTLASQASHYSFEDFMKENYPDVSLNFPKHEIDYLSAIDEMNENDRAKYYMAEAKAAVYGKFIHPDAPGAIAYKNMVRRLQNPREVTVLGNDNIIAEYKPSVSIEVVESYMSELRADWRGMEASFNAVKHKLEELDYEKVQEHTNAQHAKIKEHSRLMSLYNAEWTAAQEKLRKEVSDVKIRIPEVFKDIYDYLQSLGKTK